MAYNKVMTPEPDIRPDPDLLLATLQAQDPVRRRGSLKIFLGYAAGVGKTYAMLEAARQRKSQGVDVAAGYIETHGRAETERLLAGLEILPRREVEYHGIRLPEMDVDAILARRPALVLVDEFAHTNAPGSRHPKRYLDVEEIRDAGIDVFTTLNIQHIESLNDVVAQVTGVIVRETVPDRVFDEADDIEVVDLPPEELLIRLREGKVYVPDQAARAVANFFRRGNLTALREVTLRRAAKRVDDQMRAYMHAREIPGPWAAGERLMVCISPGALGDRLIRSARRLADEWHCDWRAVYVETPDNARLSVPEQEQIARALTRAEELGAKTVTLSGSPLQKVILDYARRHNITRILVGKPLRPVWQERLQGSLVNKLIRESGPIDVFVISGEQEKPKPIPVRGFFPHRPLNRYLWSVLLVTAATLLSYLIKDYLDPTNLVMVYLLAVMIAATNLGKGPSMLTSLLGVLAFDFFFVPPYLTMAVSDTEYILTFGALFAVGFVISQLADRLRVQAEFAERRRGETTSLYGLSRDLAVAKGMDSILQAITNNIAQTFDRDVLVFLPDKSGTLEPIAATTDFQTGENELAVAEWAYKHGQPAGRGTDTLPAAPARYIPLRTANAVIGVLAVRPRDPARHLPPEGYRLLEAFASQAALAVERVQLSEQAQQAKLLEATEKLQSALLNSLSHDLRTPLVSITGAVTSLDDPSEALSDEDRRSLIRTARGETERLNRLVGNLLSMTRIESGALRLHRQPEDVPDIIRTAVDLLGTQAAGNPIRVNIPPDFPPVPVDFALIAQALVNILENAVKYSPPGSPIDIIAGEDGSTAHIEIADCGVGIPSEETANVFEKFYRVQRPENVSGSGLGLSICKGIIDAHGGKIFALPRAGGGTVIAIELPLGE
jgi:two-component system, OmpR family, sensor histidine kinase KdpD